MAAADVAFVEGAGGAGRPAHRLAAAAGTRVGLPAGRVLAERGPAAHLRAATRAAARRRRGPRRPRRRRAAAAPTTRRPSCTSPTSAATAACSSRRVRWPPCAGRPGCRSCSTPPSRWARRRRPGGRRRLRHLPQVAGRAARGRHAVSCAPRSRAAHPRAATGAADVEGVPPACVRVRRRARRRPGGLVVALGEHLAAGPDRVRDRLAALGRATRGADSTASAAGGSSSRWTSPPRSPRCARLPASTSPPSVARLLAEHGVLITAVGRERARGELTGPVLRVSPHLDATLDDLDALAAGLAP